MSAADQVITLGCRLNLAESEAIRAMLAPMIPGFAVRILVSVSNLQSPIQSPNHCSWYLLHMTSHQ